MQVLLPVLPSVSAPVPVPPDPALLQRNLSDYEGDPVTDAAVRECLIQADAVLAHTRQWLQSNRPDLLTEN